MLNGAEHAECVSVYNIETYHHFMGQSGHKMEFGTASQWAKASHRTAHAISFQPESI